ncbi:MAG: META domain-containing protein [Daejeonella sp.]
MRPHLLLCLLVLSGCSAINSSADLPRLGESTWNLTAIEQRPVNFNGRAFIKFDEKESKISGKALCNSYFSEYEMIGKKVTFSSVGSTKMYCEGMMDEENQIITNLQKTKRYDVKSDFLYFYAGEKLVLTFKR